MPRLWTKNSYRKLSAQHLRSLRDAAGETVYIACTKAISSSDVYDYKHLGLGSDIENWGEKSPILPASDIGRYSSKNVDGWEIVRKDLPKTTKSWTTEHVNFGDASRNGYHYKDHTREVYQRQFFEAPRYTINVESKRNTASESLEWLVSFKVNAIFPKSVEDGQQEILFAVNLLQENVGASQIYSSTVAVEELLKSNTIAWEIFPEGTAEDIIRTFNHKGEKVTLDEKRILEERVEFFNRLNPKQLIVGTGGFGGYFGAVYSEDTVVFENVRYGNAVYVLFANWKDVSKRSRYDLLKGTDDNYHRIVHSKGWQRRLYMFLNERLNGKPRRRPTHPRLL